MPRRYAPRNDVAHFRHCEPEGRGNPLENFNKIYYNNLTKRRKNCAQIKSNQIKSNQIKSNQIKSNSIILLFSLLFCGILLTLTSCENFLKGANVAEELREAIEIANSNPTTIYIEAPKDSGTLSITQVKVKRKENFDLKFTPSDNWQFVNWEVFDPATEQIVQDYVKFDDETKTEVKAKLLKAAEKLIIKAKCYELPAIVSVTPSSSQEAFANEPIVITFNTPLASEVMKYEDGYISLKYNNEDLSKLFETPALSDDGKTVTLKPNGTLVSDYIESKNIANILVDVKLGTKIVQSEIINGKAYSFPLIQNDNSSFAVRYKAEMERIKPKKFDFFATASKFNLDEAAAVEENSKFSYDDIASQGTFTEEEYKAKILQNRINNTVYIYGRYYDADSGVKSVKITHKRTNSKDGTQVNESLIKPEPFTAQSGNTEFFTQDGYTKFCVEYHLADDKTKEDWGDGAILFSVSVLDGAGNETDAETFTIIKDSFVDLSEAEIWNRKYVNKTSENEWSKRNFQNENALYNNLLVPMTKHISLDLHSTAVKSYRNLMLKNYHADNIYLEYESKTGLVKQKMLWNEEKSLYETDLNVDSVNSLVLTLYVMDEFGNENTKCFQMPYPIEYHIGPDYKGGYCYRIKTENTKYYHISTLPYQSIPFSGSLNETSVVVYKSYPYTLFFAGYDADAKLCGDFVRVTESLPSDSDAETFDCISDISIKDNEFIFYLSDDLWDNYSELAYKVEGTCKWDDDINKFVPLDYSSSNFSYATVSNIGYLSGGDDKKIIFNKNYDILKYFTDVKISIYAITSNGVTKKKCEKTYTLNRAGTEGSYTFGISNDTRPPEATLTYLTATQRVDKFGMDEEFLDDYLIVTATDLYMDSDNNIINSGISRFELYINNGKTAVFNENELRKLDDKTFVIPMYGRYKEKEKPDGGPNWYFECKVSVYDNNNNITVLTNRIKGCSLDLTEIDYSNGIYSLRFGGSYVDTVRIHLYSFSDGKWNFKETFSFDDSHRLEIRIPEESGVYKLVPGYYNKEYDICLNPPRILFTGGKSSGEYDLFFKNGGSSPSYVIASDQPVYVQTIVTTKDYATCKDWDAATWESNFPCHLRDIVLEFSPSDYTPKRYTVPIDKIHSGECYVVIAQYSNGEKIMSEVFVKE